MSRSRLWARWRKWALVLGIFALGIPLSSAMLVRSSGSRARLHDLATTVIRDELGLRATIGSVQLQLVPFSLVARDITLDDPVYGRFAEADELRISPSFRALLRGALDLRSISIEGADLRLVVRNGQIRNLPRAEGGGGGGPPELPFDELHVLDSTLTVDAQPHASGQLRHVDLHVRGIDGGLSVEARSQDGWVRHRGGRDTIALVDGHVEVTEDVLRVPRLELRTPDARLAVRGGEAPMTFGEHGYRGRVEVSYDLAHLARLPLPPEVTLPPFSGRVSVEATLESEGEEQRARGTIDTESIQIDGQWGTGERGHLVFAASRERVELLDGSRVHLLDDGGHVDVTGTVGLNPDEGFPVDLRADVDELSFARLMATLSVTENAIVEWFFNGHLGLRGTLDPLSLEGPVHVQTHDFRVSHDPYHAERVRRVIGVSHGDFDGRWSIRPDAVRFSHLVGVLPRSRIRGDVHLGFDNRLGVQAVSEVLDLRDISPLDRWPILGTGTARCEIDGSFQAPHVTGHVALDGFVFDDFRLGRIESDAVLDPDGLGVRFPMVTALKRDSRYRAEDLYLDFHHDRFEMTGMLRLDGMLLADFYHVFGFEEDERFEAYQGLARGQASLRYTNGFPDDSPSGTLDVDLNLSFDWADLNDFRFEDGRMVGHWRWLDWDRGAAGAELEVAHLSLRKGEGTLSLDGRMSLGGNLRFDAVADRIALSQLEGVGDRLPGLDGVTTVVGRIGGTVDVMQADFDVGVTNVTYEGRPLGDGRFFVRMTDRDAPWVAEARRWNRRDLPPEDCAHARTGLAHADWPADPPMQTVDGPQPRLDRPMAFLICGRGLDDRLAVDLAIGRTEPLPVRGIVRLEDLDLSPLLPRLPNGQRTEGGVSGVLAFDQGALRSPETLEGTVTLDHVRVAAADLEIRNHRPVDLAFKDGILAIHKARFVGPDSRLRVRGRASLDHGLALQVNADVDLGLLSRVSDSVTDASGRIDARLNVTGPFADPELYGEAAVQDGAFDFADLETGVDGLEGRVRFSQRSVLLEGFEADVAGGHVRASGSAELRDQGIERYAIDLDARDIAYDFADGVDASFGARAELAWSRGERLPTLRGELQVGRFAYTRPIELRSLGDIAASAMRGFLFGNERTEVRRYDPEQDLVSLDLRVAQRAPFRIENNLIEAQMRIRSDDRPFRIVGTDQRYGVQGTMDITRGTIVFQNNEFDIRRGTVDFDDTTRIDPRVNVEAVTEIRRSSDLSSVNWRIWLTLTGSSENLRLATRSEPELPEPDILMLLAFGMTRAELQQLQQGGDLASAAALEAITSVTGVDREIRRALPLIDDFRLTTGYSYRTGRSEPRLSIGKRIAERVRLSATTGLGEGREFRGALEWQLDDNQRIGLSYDNYNVTGTASFGNLGVDWGYRLEFE
ncbi:MAG TPA: translocation/assembly module TamB domain-containing protein [Sandaracinaceae bacterium LLY-WYZ-13_1]|nr:translocation/assembly module TamB domain-containing protein [Sandaracinaceae bacterium LLY-WYZ-13_1]